MLKPRDDTKAPCKVCDFENAKVVGRAKWCCPICGRDYSMEYLFWAEAVHPEWFNEMLNKETSEGE